MVEVKYNKRVRSDNGQLDTFYIQVNDGFNSMHPVPEEPDRSLGTPWLVSLLQSFWGCPVEQQLYP